MKYVIVTEEELILQSPDRQEKQADSAIELWSESVSFYTSAASNCFALVIIT